MDQRLEKAIDIMSEQAGQLDKIATDMEAMKSYVQRLESRLDSVLTSLGEILSVQMSTREKLDIIEEQQEASVELFIGVSKRVDVLEKKLTPPPGNGSFLECTGAD